MRINIKIVMINLIMLISTLVTFKFFKLDDIRYIAFIYISYLYYQIFKRFIRNEVDIVDLFIAYIILYPLFGIMIFTNRVLFDDLVSFINKPILYSQYYVFKYVVVIMIGLMPFSFVLGSKTNKLKAYNKGKEFPLNYNILGKITEIAMFIFILFLMYVYYITGGQYLWFTDYSNKSMIFSMIANYAILLSALIPFSYKESSYSNNKRFLLLNILVIVLLSTIKIRMYSALFIFSLLLNLNIRGLKIDKRKSVLLMLLLILLLAGNMFRFQYFDFYDRNKVFYSTFGEFIMPNISAFYLINNPLDYSDVFRIKDLFLQMLPSVIRPYASLYEFRDYYISRGFDPWPIGGIYYQGQLFYYFNVLFVIVNIIIANFLLKAKKRVNQGRYSLILIGIPIFSMVFPRMEIWVLRSVLIAILFFIIVRVLFLKVYKNKRIKNT